MMMTTTLLNPTGEHEIVARRKAAGDVFLDRIAERLGERGVAVKRYAKPSPNRPAVLETRQRMMAETQVAIIGLAD